MDTTKKGKCPVMHGANTETNNELIEIGKELAKFIAHINKTEK